MNQLPGTVAVSWVAPRPLPRLAAARATVRNEGGIPGGVPAPQNAAEMNAALHPAGRSQRPSLLARTAIVVIPVVTRALLGCGPPKVVWLLLGSAPVRPRTAVPSGHRTVPAVSSAS